jgi:hypothetical protein
MINEFGKKRAIKKYLKNLPTALRQRYGASEKYTDGQVHTTIEHLGLSQRYIEFAYLMFCGEQALIEQGKEQLYIDKLSAFLAQGSFGGGAGGDSWHHDGSDGMFDGGGFGDGGGGGDA